MNKLIASSLNPKELSLMVKGALVAIVPIIALILNTTGNNISHDELNYFIELITDFAFAAGSLLSISMMLYGAARKLFRSL